MADEANEESWLYESSGGVPGNEDDSEEKIQDEQKSEVADKIDPEIAETKVDDEAVEFEAAEADDGMEEEHADKKDEDSDDSEDSDDDDDINVVIGDIKTAGSSYNLKPRAQILNTATTATEKTKIPTGKFSIEEFESVGTINGQPAHEFAMETIEEKPWRKPGSDITDYFNYGFNEDTWRAYCERQKKMRVHESGIGLSGLSVNVQSQSHSHNNSMSVGIRKNIPPPMRHRITSIDVIGSAHNRDRDGVSGGYGGHHHNYNGPPPGKSNNPKENVIQVMTADRREYSRTVTGNKFDASMPPPFEQELLPDPFFTGEDPFAYGYEPTQDSQWDPSQAPAPAWAPTGIKELTGHHQQHPGQMIPPHGMMVPPHQQMMMGPPMGHPMMPSGPNMRPDVRDKDRDGRDRGEKEIKQEDMSRDRSDDKDRDKDSSSSRRSSRSDKHRERASSRKRSRSRESSVRESSKRSRSREKSRRRSKSRDKKSKDKKKSYRKDREESE